MTEARLRAAGYSWAAMLALILALLSLAVNDGLLRMSDRVLLNIAQAPGTRLLDWVMAGISLLGSVQVTAPLMLLLVFLTRRLSWASWQRWLPLAIFALLTLVELGAKSVVRQPAPPSDLLRSPFFSDIGLGTAYSFPSGHMTRVTLLFGLIALRVVRRTRQPLWLWACIAAVWIVGFSRVYLGEHWPVDVAGGILLGGAGLALCLAVTPAGSIGDLQDWPRAVAG